MPWENQSRVLAGDCRVGCDTALRVGKQNVEQAEAVGERERGTEGVMGRGG